MAKEISEQTKVTLDLKTIGIVAAGMVTIIGMWFALQSDIQLAKELPAPKVPEVFEQEFRMKDGAIRDAVMQTNEDIEEIKEHLKVIDQRLYDLQTR